MIRGRLIHHRALLNRRSIVPLFALWLSVGTAIGQTVPTSREQADTLFERGKSALKAGDWITACVSFEQSLALDESASTLVKLARCHEHEGHLSQAIADYARAGRLIRTRPAIDRHARDLESLIQSASAALESRLGHVRLLPQPRPARATVTVDAQPVAEFTLTQSEWVLPLDPGSHTIEVRADSYETTSLSLQVTESQSLDTTVKLTPSTASPDTHPIAKATLAASGTAQAPARVTIDSTTRRAPAVPLPKPNQAPASERSSAALAHSGRPQRIVGYVTGSAGFVLAGMAGYFAFKTASAVSDARADNHCDGDFRCDRRGLELIDTAREQQTNAIISGVCGGIMITTGIVLVATAAPARPNPKRIAVTITPFAANIGGQW